MSSASSRCCPSTLCHSRLSPASSTPDSSRACGVRNDETRDRVRIVSRHMDITTLSWKCFRVSSFISRRNLSFDFPQEYSIPTPATSGWNLGDITKMCPRFSTVCCSAVRSFLKSGRPLRTLSMFIFGSFAVVDIANDVPSALPQHLLASLRLSYVSLLYLPHRPRT